MRNEETSKNYKIAFLRPVPTRPISRRPTAIVGRLPSADSRGFKILNRFDRDSRPTITESVVESADSAVESADYWSRPTGNGPSGYGPLDLLWIYIILEIFRLTTFTQILTHLPWTNEENINYLL